MTGSLNGRGPGGGSSVNHSGGYGGIGGYAGGGFGVTYGSAIAPADPGSGGGGWNTSGGGNGGGAIWIEATGQVVANGTITANGDMGYGNNCGGGSGGSIYIRCDTFAGTNGTLIAKGGDRQLYSASSGGGGRIAVNYTNTATQGLAPVPSVRFSTAPGADDTFTLMGDIGTLYFPDNRFLTETIVHSGQWITPGLFTNWAPNNLTISNGWIRFPAQGFALTVTNDVAVIGGSPSLNKLELTPTLMSCGGNIVLTNGSLLLYNGTTSNPTLTCGGNLTLIPGWLGMYSAATSGPSLNCGGDFIMANGSSAVSNMASVYSGMTNVGGPNYSAQVNVTGDMRMGSNSCVYSYSHSKLGGAVRFSMRTLSVASKAGFNADAKGYAGGVSGDANGHGPGGGPGSKYGGGAYGGFGGNSDGVNAATYGFASAPTDPGSGGGYANTIAGYGGGVVWIEATGQVLMNGFGSANGGAVGSGAGGGGSGGSIYIRCDTFAGTNGTLSAKGGYSSCNGGGGRIAVIYTNTAAQGVAPIPSILFSTAPGNAIAVMGDIGTLYFPDSRFLTEIIPHTGQWMVPGFTNWSPNNLTISNAWVRFPVSDFSLTVSNAITVLGGNIPLNRFDLTPLLIRCGGDLTLTNISGVTTGSYLYLRASTNSIPAADGCGPRVAIGGTLTIGSNSVIYPYSHLTNGCGIGFQMQNLTIAGGGSIKANALGYRGGLTTNAIDRDGKRPGRLAVCPDFLGRRWIWRRRRGRQRRRGRDYIWFLQRSDSFG